MKKHEYFLTGGRDFGLKAPPPVAPYQPATDVKCLIPDTAVAKWGVAHRGPHSEDMNPSLESAFSLAWRAIRCLDTHSFA